MSSFTGYGLKCARPFQHHGHRGLAEDGLWQANAGNVGLYCHHIEETIVISKAMNRVGAIIHDSGARWGTGTRQSATFS